MNVDPQGVMEVPGQVIVWLVLAASCGAGVIGTLTVQWLWRLL